MPYDKIKARPHKDAKYGGIYSLKKKVFEPDERYFDLFTRKLWIKDNSFLYGSSVYDYLTTEEYGTADLCIYCSTISYANSCR